jgi:uncharacterized protein YbbC (DUF1343 family)
LLPAVFLIACILGNHLWWGGIGTWKAPRRVLTGIDVLERDKFKLLEGRRIGLITNHTGKDGGGNSTIDLLAGAPNLKLVALLSPEHGLRGMEDAPVASSRDEKTGLPIYSLYQRDRRRPSAEMLQGIDTLVFDIQDVGARFYTYVATCGYALEEAASNRIRMVVLDRPDPINGIDVEGPLADAGLTGQFVAYHSLPVRYGMTIGELAMLFNSERRIGADLKVIKMEGWRRGDYFDDTGLTWKNPSPNMRSLSEAILYPGIGLLETTNVSVGRGTQTPFEVVGAPWIDGRRLAKELNMSALAGVRFNAIDFMPQGSIYAGQQCGGVRIVITDRISLHSVEMGIEIAYQLNRLYKDVWKIEGYLNLLASRRTFQALKHGQSRQEITALWRGDLEEFGLIRARYLLY